MSYHTTKKETINENEVNGEKILSFCAYSNTIRQLPENYCIAVFKRPYHSTNTGCWVLEPDLAADSDLVCRVARELLNFDSKYEKSGLKLLAKL